MQFAAAGKLPAAEIALRKAMERKPKDPRTIMLQGVVAEKHGDFREAARLLTSVSQALSTEPLAAAALATSCYHAGTIDQARSCMHVIRNASPRGIFLVATAAADAEDFATAEAMLVSIKLSYPDPAAVGYQLALVQYHAGHIADSQTTLMDMIGKGESNADVHNLLGWCWFKSNDLNQAEQEMKESIRLDPAAVTNYLDLARMQLAGQQLDAALESSTHTVTLFPKSAEAWLLKGSIETAAQRLTDAVASYTTAVHLSSNDPDAELALATAQWLAGMTSQSRAGFQRLLQRYPRNAAIYVGYADFLTSVAPGETGQVTRLMKTASSLDPSLAEPHYYLGNLALTGGRLDEAVHQLETAIRLDPDSSKAHFALSHALRQQGRPEESARELAIYNQLKTAEDGATGSVR
ncbi:MAG: tetratricopeptide repeat protein [Acidobacteriaceae bacterium]